MIVGQSPAMQQLMKMVIKVARTDANILITGENGTGKEMLAREIHHLSPRRKQEMVTVNMGATNGIGNINKTTRPPSVFDLFLMAFDPAYFRSSPYLRADSAMFA